MEKCDNPSQTNCYHCAEYISCKIAIQACDDFGECGDIRCEDCPANQRTAE